MPRKSFQVFSDYNTKVVSGYSESNGGTAQAAKLKKERIENVHGSCAGASSGEFHMYLNQRNREKFRLESIEAKEVEDEEKRLYQEKVRLNKQLEEERTKKNADKRKRAKAKKSQQNKKARSSESSSEERESNGHTNNSSADN